MPSRGRNRRVAGWLMAGMLTMMLASPGAAWAAKRSGLPASFFGVDADNTLLDGSVNLNAQAAAMRRSGTGAIRFPVYWSGMQPVPSIHEISKRLAHEFTVVDGTPTNFTTLDAEMLDFVRHGLRPLPVILQTPVWARLYPGQEWSVPALPATYGRFVGALVARYGTNGTFWRKHHVARDLRPDWWQIWNEPAGGNSPDSGDTVFWYGPEPYEPTYIAMLRAARSAARAADPHAKILLAGFFGNSWAALNGIYKYGGKGLFDGVAVHPYADTAAHVGQILANVRVVMYKHKDLRLPMFVTETGWTSSTKVTSPGLEGIATTPALQASNLTQEYKVLTKYRRLLNLQGIYWYSWLGEEPSTDPFEYSGLFWVSPDGAIHAKPAFSAYEKIVRRLER